MCILIAALVAMMCLAGVAVVLFAFVGLMILFERWFGDSGPIWLMAVLFFLVFFAAALHDHICHF